MDRVEKHVFTKIAKKYNIPIDAVADMYASQFELIREKIIQLDFDKYQTEEELYQDKITFNVPRLFKIHPIWKSILAMRKLSKKEE